MSILCISTMLPLALALALAIPCSLSAADSAAPTIANAPIINKVCPMDGKPIDATSPTVLMTIGEGAEAKHYRLAMCSDACCTDFKKDPMSVLTPKFGKFAPGAKTLFK